jgi:hypothetical protein
MRKNLANHSDVLEDPQDLVVEGDRPRDLPDGSALFDDQSFYARLPKPTGSNGSHRAETHNHNVEYNFGAHG